MIRASSKKRRRAQSSPNPFAAPAGRFPVLAIRTRPLFLDLSASGFDRSAGTFGHRQTLDGHGLGEFAGQEHLGALDVGIDKAGGAQGGQIGDITIDGVQVAEANLGTHHSDAGGETEFRQTLLQGHLSAFEPGTHTATGTGFLTLVTTATGLAETAADTATEAFAFLDPTRGGTQCVQTHDHSPSTLTM